MRDDHRRGLFRSHAQPAIAFRAIQKETLAPGRRRSRNPSLPTKKVIFWPNEPLGVAAVRLSAPSVPLWGFTVWPYPAEG